MNTELNLHFPKKSTSTQQERTLTKKSMRMNAKSSITRCYILLLFACITASGCLGGLHLSETHYFSIPNVDSTNKNYFRLRVKGQTFLSNTEYYSGWFPSESIDELFGDISAEGNTEYIVTQRALKKLNNKYILQTEENYLKEAAKKKASGLDSLLDARRRIQAYPSFESLRAPAGNGTISYHYNPALNRVLPHVDEKLVFFLSSNPDEIISEIDSYTQANETAIKIKSISNALQHNRTKTQNEQQMAYEFNLEVNEIISNQITNAIETIKNSNDKDVMIATLKSIQSTIKNSAQ